MEHSLITSNDNGIYCPVGDFYVDPWGKVPTAIVTHAHADHLRPGSKNYITATSGHGLVEHRLNQANSTYNSIVSYDYGDTFTINGVTTSLHPAGHLLGSCQVMLEYNNEIVILTGDYKHQSDPTCQPYEQLKGDIFVTEATFGLPIYKWPPKDQVIEQIVQWIYNNKNEGKATNLFGYALGKAQRLLAEIGKNIDETIYIHGALDQINEIYRLQSIELPPTELVVDQPRGFDFTDKIVISPPSAFKSKFMNRFKASSSAISSGWARVRGKRRFGGYNTGFILSDHVDFSGLVKSVNESQANQVYVGFTKSPAFVRYVNEELGIDCNQLDIRFSGDDD